MSNTRGVIHLGGGDFSHANFASRGDAEAFIRGWSDRVRRRIEKGEMDALEIVLMNSDDAGGFCGAWYANQIIGMYIAPDRSAQDRVAGAMEKMVEAHGEGEDWMG